MCSSSNAAAGTPCNQNGGSICNGSGQCVVNTLTDPNNCGAIGHVCAPAFSSPNCGGCNIKCGAGQTCSAGQCRWKETTGDEIRASVASTFQADMQKDLSDATSVGVSGTPAFVIGTTSANGLDGVRIVGAQPYAAFDAKLKELLATK
ncbi:MAG TPA: hypothetical protein VFA27_03450 [Vicinamibacterales bacterium]|nr:hypothetical protein [Vicinamibacterales bacterium]